MDIVDLISNKLKLISSLYKQRRKHHANIRLQKGQA